MPVIRSVAVALAWAACALCVVHVAGAQSSEPPPLFVPLRLAPAPSATRLASGAPGPQYWQNRADYALTATLDTAAHVVHGTLVLRYTNHAPRALDTLWVQTEQDPREQLEAFTQQVRGAFVPVTVEHHPTEARVILAAPIGPGATATFHVAWQFVVLPTKGGRMGRDGALYEVAQWYPRVNVYDDVKGWNTEPYTTNAEFYLEYGDYTLEVTVPAGYIVAATGTLDNPQDVLTAPERARLAQAAQADTVVPIVTAAELQSGAARPKRDGLLTWKFHATNVRDAVWGASPEYRWDATSWHGVLAQAYSRVTAGDTWNEVPDMARASIQEYSERWYPYPYPQISVVEGIVDGMEYPMLAMVKTKDPRQKNSKFWFHDVITHEVGHNWFPMIVGSNERVHTWMDEGFDQFINTFSNARRFPAMGDQNVRAGTDVAAVEAALKKHEDKPLETGAVIGNTEEQYFKTSAVLQMLRRDVLGPVVFDKGLRTYVRRWAYKHPTPMDFFRTMNEAAGKSLDWFWREWFLETPNFDQAIDSVRLTTRGAEARVTVAYHNKGRGVLPLLVRFTFGDGSTQEFSYPATSAWEARDGRQVAMYVVTYTFPGKTVSRIELDPDGHLVDADRANNTWTAP